jgi:hypothetical protein
MRFLGHALPLAMRGPNLNAACGSSFPHRISTIWGISGRSGCRKREIFFPSYGKKCDIDFPIKWKVFSTLLATTLPYIEHMMGISAGLCFSTFGNEIAKECMTD